MNTLEFTCYMREVIYGCGYTNYVIPLNSKHTRLSHDEAKEQIALEYYNLLAYLEGRGVLKQQGVVAEIEPMSILFPFFTARNTYQTKIAASLAGETPYRISQTVK